MFAFVMTFPSVVFCAEAYVGAIPPADHLSEGGRGPVELCRSLFGFKFVSSGLVL